jgi:hypothetical protein
MRWGDGVCAGHWYAASGFVVETFMETNKKMKQPVIVKQDEEEAIAAEVIAKALIDISKATKAILGAGLKYETIVTLVHAHCGVAKRDIRLVINNLDQMQSIWCSK